MRKQGPAIDFSSGFFDYGRCDLSLYYVFLFQFSVNRLVVPLFSSLPVLCPGVVVAGRCYIDLLSFPLRCCGFVSVVLFFLTLLGARLLLCFWKFVALGSLVG